MQEESIKRKGGLYMVEKKDYSLVAVISNLTQKQAANISAEMMKAKNKYAPGGRGTIATGEKGNVKKLLQRGCKKIGKKN